MARGTALRLVVVMALWALCFPLIALGLGSAPHLAFASMRAVLAGICLLALGVLFGRPMPAGGHVWILLAVTGLGATTLGFLGMFHAAEFLAPGLATVIANAQPLLAAVLGNVFLVERLGFRGNLGLVVGFLGIVAIAWPGIVSEASSSFALGLSYIALAATGVAIGNVAMKRLAGRVDAVMAMGTQLLLGGIPLVLLSLSTEDFASVVWTANLVLILVALAVLGTSLAFWLWFAALEETRLNIANTFTFLVPVFGLAAGAVFFDERLGWFGAAGSALVVFGVLLVQRDAPKKRASKAIPMT